MTRMTTDVDTLSNLLQTGLVNALVERAHAGRRADRAVRDEPAAHAGRAHDHAAARVPHGVVPAPIGACLRAGARRDLQRQRRVPGEPVGHPGRAGVRARGPQHRVVPVDDRSVPERPDHRAAAPGPLLPTDPVLRGVRAGDRARLRRLARAPGRDRHRHRDHVPAVPRPVLRARSSSSRRCSSSGSRQPRRSTRSTSSCRRRAPRRRRCTRSAPSGLRGAIRFDDVHFSYPSATATAGTEILHGVSVLGRAGRDDRARRRHRRREVDDREARRPLLRRRRGHGVDRRRPRHRLRPRRVPPPARLRARRSRSCSPAPSATTSPTGAPTRRTPRWSAPRGPSARTTSSPTSPAATSTRSPSAAGRCRRARSS